MLQWASVAAFLAATILIFDFITMGIGVVDTVKPYFVSVPAPRVNAKIVDAPGGASCLELAFSDLPPDFKIGDISLKVVKAEGPTSVSGDAAASIVTRPVNLVLAPSVFRPNPSDIVVKARLMATVARDALYVDVCPILSLPGTAGTIWIMPTFHSVNGQELADLVVTTNGEPLPPEGLPLSVAHPKYINVDLQEESTELIER